ncbi:hypothetical protein SKAU_G00379050 [Synaphobranchus kaupii]|uniref:Uncharacterized protein n=1 Tax=Synaphobranchus kaupii TaxID=118154 RepID=A0A9Q1ED86_SYNKA|nr:hypothetical protein SKAU_G00379050 [Synaphobranchus kaupii]
MSARMNSLVTLHHPHVPTHNASLPTSAFRAQSFGLIERAPCGAERRPGRLSKRPAHDRNSLRSTPYSWQLAITEGTRIASEPVLNLDKDLAHTTTKKDGPEVAILFVWTLPADAFDADATVLAASQLAAVAQHRKPRPSPARNGQRKYFDLHKSQ